MTINTDGTLFTQTTLSLEYMRIAAAFNWTLDDFLRANIVAVAASSFSATTKKRLIAKLHRQYKAIGAILENPSTSDTMKRRLLSQLRRQG